MGAYLKNLSSNKKYAILNLFFVFIIQGLCFLLVGSVLPEMKAEYGLSYTVGGAMVCDIYRAVRQ